MTEFTKEYIYKVRVYSTLIDEPASEVIEECLDEIERLQARVQELEEQLSFFTENTDAKYPEMPSEKSINFTPPESEGE